jgi:FkbM family methyltransferase
MKEVFLLIGPIATGKSYIGKLIEKEFNIPFFEYEDIFIEEQKKDPKGYLKRAEPLAKHAIFEFLKKNNKICIENTMSRPYAFKILDKLQQVADVRLIYINTPLEITLKRLGQRNKNSNVKWSDEEIEKINKECKRLDFKYDLVIDNTNVSNERILEQLRTLIEERVWQKDYIEIKFKGQYLKFNSWSGSNLTPYDMEYKPWRASFKKENIGYLKNYKIKPGDIVIDVGGYEGTFSIYAAKIVGEIGKVIVFEPDTENCRRLSENIKLNGLKNVIIVNKALWCKNGKLKFNNKHTAGASFNFNASPYAKEIDVVSLDSELNKLGIDKVDFIKMDIEGSEVEALKGAKNVLMQNKVNLAVASYHIINGEETSTEVENILRKFGYQAKTDFPEHKTTYGYKK